MKASHFRYGFLLSLAAAAMMLIVVAVPAWSGTSEDANAPAEDARLAPLRAQIDVIRGQIKQNLNANGLEGDQLQQAIGVFETFARSYSRVALGDESKLAEDVLQHYIDGKVMPRLDSLGLSLQAGWLVDNLKSWTRSEIEILQIQNQDTSSADAGSDSGAASTRGRRE